MNKLRYSLLILFGVNRVMFASDQEIILDPISVEAEQQSDEANYVLDPVAPLTYSLTLSDLLINEGLGVKTKKWEAEESIAFRGMTQDAILFLIDDIPMYKTVNGSVNTQIIGLSSLSSVMIIRGETISPWGAPIGGTIALESRKPKRTFESDIGVTLEPLSHSEQIYVGSLHNNYYLTFNADYQNSRGYELSKDFTPTAIEDGCRRLNSDYTKALLDFKFGKYFTNGGEASIRIFKGEQNSGVPPYVYDDVTTPFLRFTRITDVMNSGIYLSYDAPENRSWEWKGRVYGDKHTDTLLTYTDENYDTYLFDPSLYKDYRFGGLVLGRYQYSGATQIGIRGLLERNIHNHYDGEDPVRRFEADTFSFSGTSITQLNPNLKTSAMLGYERLSPVKTYQWNDPSLPSKDNLRDSLEGISWQMAVQYNQDSGSKIEASVGSKVKMPTMNQFFPLMPWDNINTDLKEERSLAWDVTWKNDDLRIAGFWYDINNLIAYDSVSGAYYNRNKALIRGFEIDSIWHINLFDELRVHYTFTDAKDSNGYQLDNAPKHRAVLIYALKPFPNGSIDALVNYTGGNVFHDGQVGEQKLDDYMTADIRFSYRFQPFDVIMGIRNIADTNFQSTWGYPETGRTAYVTLKWSYDK